MASSLEFTSLANRFNQLTANVKEIVGVGRDVFAKRHIQYLTNINLPENIEEVVLELERYGNPYRAIFTAMYLAMGKLLNKEEVRGVVETLSKHKLTPAAYSDMVSAISSAGIIVNWPENRADSLPLSLRETLLPERFPKLPSYHFVLEPPPIAPEKVPSAPEIENTNLLPRPKKILDLAVLFPNKLPDVVKRTSEGTEAIFYKFPLKVEDMGPFVGYTEIDVSGTLIDNRQLIALLERASSLESLVIAGCPHLSSRISGHDSQIPLWEAICRHPLQSLSLEDCENFQLDCYDQILPNLIELNVMGLKLPLKFADWIVKFPQLKILKMSEGSLSIDNCRFVESKQIRIETWKDVKEPIDFPKEIDVLIESRKSMKRPWTLRSSASEAAKKTKARSEIFEIYTQKIWSYNFNIKFKSDVAGIAYADMQLCVREELNRIIPVLISALIQSSSIEPMESRTIIDFHHLLQFIVEKGPFPRIYELIFPPSQLHFCPVVIHHRIVPNLIRLSLCRQQITSLPDSFIFGFERLESLDLSANLLEGVPKLTSCIHLKELLLSGNQITYVNFDNLPRTLQKIDVSDNPLSHIDPPEEFPDLVVIQQPLQATLKSKSPTESKETFRN